MDPAPSVVSAAAMGGAALVIAAIRLLRRRLQPERKHLWIDLADFAFALTATALLVSTFALPAILPEATTVFRWTVFAFMIWSVCEEVLESRRERTREASGTVV